MNSAAPRRSAARRSPGSLPLGRPALLLEFAPVPAAFVPLRRCMRAPERAREYGERSRLLPGCPAPSLSSSWRPNRLIATALGQIVEACGLPEANDRTSCERECSSSASRSRRILTTDYRVSLCHDGVSTHFPGLEPRTALTASDHPARSESTPRTCQCGRRCHRRRKAAWSS